MGNDEKILEVGSVSQQRVAAYGALVKQLHILIFSAKKVPAQQIGNVFIYSSGGCCRLLALLKGYFLAKKIIVQNQIDLVSTQDPFESAQVAFWLKKRYVVRINIQIHGDFFSNNSWKKQRWFNSIRYRQAVCNLKRADSIRVVSTRVRKSLIEKFKIASDKIVVAPIYSDFSGFNGFMAGGGQKGSGVFIFLTVSRLTKEKNLAMALRAFAKLRKSDRQVVLQIVGVGAKKKNLERLAKKLKIQDRVQFLGWLDKEELAQQYSKADCFLLASDFEGWGLAALEAAYFALPIVMTDVGCCGEILKPGRDVLSAVPRDERGFAAAMQRVLDDDGLRADLGRNAKAALAKLPNKEQIMELYRRAWFL